MRRHRHTPEQVVRKLREGERILNEGKDLTEVLRTLEVSEATWNRWRSQYGGMKASEAKRLRELESENARLKKLVANQALDIDMLKELAEGNFSVTERIPSTEAVGPHTLTVEYSHWSSGVFTIDGAVSTPIFVTPPARSGRPCTRSSRSAISPPQARARRSPCRASCPVRPSPAVTARASPADPPARRPSRTATAP
jgi:putative transposase